MVDAGVLWTLPKEEFIKINAHSFYSDDPLPNGNSSGIGIVFRDDRGTIVRMIAGSLRIQGRRLNELYSLLFALRRAYFESYNLVELETDHGGAYWEWKRSSIDELWFNDMGLGPVDPQFEVLLEEDLVENEMDGDIEDAAIENEHLE